MPRLLSLSLVLLATPVATAQDFCTTAVPLTGNGGYVAGACSTLPSVPAWTCGGAAIGGSQWYEFTLPYFVDEFTVDTCMTQPVLQADTRLEVLEGDCNSLSIIACNDDSCGLRSSITVSNAVGGRRYYIRVGGYNNSTGLYFVQVTHPTSSQPNECSAAYALTEGVDTPFTTTGASTSPPAWSCALGGSDIWFTYRTPASTLGFFVSTRGSGYDTATEIFTGTCNGLSLVQCNDDYNGWLEGSNWVANALPNTTYYIRVGGYNGQTGVGTIVAHEWRPIGSTHCTSLPSGAGATAGLAAIGSSDALENMVTLRATNVPGNQFGLFVASRTQGFTPPPLSNTNGNLCLSGVLGRFTTVRQADPGGTFSLMLDTRNIPQGSGVVTIVPGETWYFQAWYRDLVGAGSNFTNGHRVTFD